MIGVIFNLGSEIVEVRVNGNQCLFRTGQYGGAFVPIEGLKLVKGGVIKEHPDLKDEENWKQIAIERFKEKIKGYDTEMQRINYIIEDLKKFGYVPMYLQRHGHRTRKL